MKSEAKVQGDNVGKTAPAGAPKPDCIVSKPQKYGATMTTLRA
jgi:hypothetical protein